VSLPFNDRERLAGATHLAAAILANTGDIRSTLRAAAQTACTSAGLVNVPVERLDQIVSLAIETALGPAPR
jgi:hypothetical protein